MVISFTIVISLTSNKTKIKKKYGSKLIQMQTIKKNQQQYNVKKGCVRDLLLQFNIRYVINVSDNNLNINL